MDMLVLCGSVVSCCNLCLTIWIVGRTGTDVNKAFTSKEVMTCFHEPPRYSYRLVLSIIPSAGQWSTHWVWVLSPSIWSIPLLAMVLWTSVEGYLFAQVTYLWVWVDSFSFPLWLLMTLISHLDHCKDPWPFYTSYEILPKILTSWDIVLQKNLSFMTPIVHSVHWWPIFVM